MVARVAVTGMGVLTPLGNGLKRNWESLISSKSGLKNLVKHYGEFFENGSSTDGTISEVVGAVSLPTEDDPDSGFDWKNYKCSVRGIHKKADKFTVYALEASRQAVEQSGILDSDIDRDRVGVVVGSGTGGISRTQRQLVDLDHKGPKSMSPFYIPAMIINASSGRVSIEYGFRGPSISIVTACASGADAIGNAARMIKYGEIDAAVAVGSECALCSGTVIGFATLRALSTNYNDNPEAASRPWDKGRDGFVIGEGSAALVLENYDIAVSRGATIYAELAAYGSSSDAFHITAPPEDGAGAALAMKNALKSAKIDPKDISYINAHGTSTSLGDMAEIRAMRTVFEKSLQDIYVSSTKSSIGHLLGAAGSVEAVFSILAMNGGIVPPTLNLDNPEEECEGINLVPKKAIKANLQYAMSNSFGFGGANASLIFKKNEN